ncbi:nitroimidazol reductase NimA-like FMN-containing flavoprotein (pyridoxamine 5'-phosphate oxidase superfamily) [Kribbella aluminosa]|uniref:Nitroimidazol reductase NimA-like FMN-containing flavoprotein (Pyridoxamine 5'-phosphate oxidase superfamily) n=1 Tax=Kribbella aluminosa TaxID=416017 RepID=A0ABS4UNM2_9ACTN|nr:pyridoxamine 5'-phosphate oxidase family protein [Kribbella aluminosa]MBP2353243.1 nitroimidazol reductase NimA-like FMN-containing flavoprotein (pyridoxamine 5'-phosphate oxidase superfamily) [Kribbella aluminosa]
MTAAPRPPAARKQDTLDRLDKDVDAWVSTASLDGTPYLMPLSFLWTDGTLLLSTTRTNPTARNLVANPQVQLTLGGVRDVIHVTGTVEVVEATDAEGAAFAAKAGFDPRPLPTYPFFRVTPTKIQAWREVNELKDRVLMEDGRWLV